jgi:hypothetical protein
VRDLVEKPSLPEVREHAESLNKWFEDALAQHSDSADSLGVGPRLARELVQLTVLPGLRRERAEQFAERVQRELKGYKGSPFSALYYLSCRLVELTDSNGNPEQGAAAERPRE